MRPTANHLILAPAMANCLTFRCTPPAQPAHHGTPWPHTSRHDAYLPCLLCPCNTPAAMTPLTSLDGTQNKPLHSPNSPCPVAFDRRTDPHRLRVSRAETDMAAPTL